MQFQVMVLVQLISFKKHIRNASLHLENDMAEQWNLSRSGQLKLTQCPASV